MMNDGEDTGALAPYPSPPQHLWKEFTKEKVERIQRLREGNKSFSSSDLPEDLAFLEPPPPPNGQWRLFGQLHDLSDSLPSLEDQGVARLGPLAPSTSVDKDTHANKVFELKKLSKSLLLNFLELTSTLSTNPNEAAEKLADLQTIFYNMHQHINEWRPHQTREALISLLQSQLETKRNETRALHEVTDSVRRTLVGLASIQDPETVDLSTVQEKTVEASLRTMSIDAERTRYNETWIALDEMFG